MGPLVACVADLPLGACLLRRPCAYCAGDARVGAGRPCHAPRREPARPLQFLHIGWQRLRPQPAAPRPFAVPPQRSGLLSFRRQRRHRKDCLCADRHGPGGAALAASRLAWPHGGDVHRRPAGLLSHAAVLQPLRPQRHPDGGDDPRADHRRVAVHARTGSPRTSTPLRRSWRLRSPPRRPSSSPSSPSAPSSPSFRFPM